MDEIKHNDKQLVQCESCGKWGVENEDVFWCEDPYNAEINDDYSEHFLCAKCLQEKRDDI